MDKRPYNDHADIAAFMRFLYVGMAGSIGISSHCA